MSEAVKVIGLTLADVKRNMGLIDNTTYDSYIESQIEARADLLLEDIFPVTEMLNLTANQKARAKEGLSMLLAADCLTLLPVNSAVNSGTSSLRGAVVGPLEIQYNNTGQLISDIKSLAKDLRTQGESILRTLRLVGVGKTLEWAAIGTPVKPTYVGGPRYGLRGSYGHH